MKMQSIGLKNFAAGRKALFKRVLVYGGTALAAYEFISTILNETDIAKLLENNAVYQQYVSPVANNLLVYLLVAVLLAVLMQRGFSRYSQEISGTKIEVEVSIGNIFDREGGIVIPSNNIFTNSPRIMGDSSIQAQLNEMYNKGEFKNSESVDGQIAKYMASDTFKNTVEPTGQQSLAGTMFDVYPYGTMIPIIMNKRKKQKHFYLLAMTRFEAPGCPQTDNKTLLSTIDRMWTNIEKYKIADDTLVVPVMGTGSAGMVEKPKHIVAKYILKSFVNHAPKLGIKHLILSIHPNDYLNNEIDMEELRRYVDYVCSFPESDFGLDD